MSEYDQAMMEEQILWEEYSDLHDMWVRVSNEEHEAFENEMNASKAERNGEVTWEEYVKAYFEWRVLSKCDDMIMRLMDDVWKKYQIAEAREEALA